MSYLNLVLGSFIFPTYRSIGEDERPVERVWMQLEIKLKLMNRRSVHYL